MYIHNASCAISDTLLWIFRMLNIVYYIKLQCSVNCSAFWFDYRFWRLFQVDQHSKLCTNYHLHCKQLDCFDLLVGWNTQACDKMHVSKYLHRKARNKQTQWPKWHVQVQNVQDVCNLYSAMGSKIWFTSTHYTNTPVECQQEPWWRRPLQTGAGLLQMLRDSLVPPPGVKQSCFIPHYHTAVTFKGLAHANY